MPREIEEEFIADFDELYAQWAVPQYGSWAPFWAWGQVLKAVAVIIYDAASEFRGKAGKRAR